MNGLPLHHKWKDRICDPMLTSMLCLQAFAIFVAVPLAALDYPIPHDAIEGLLLLFVLLVVLVSRGRVATVMAVIAIACGIAGMFLRIHAPSETMVWIGHLGVIIGFMVLSFVVGQAVFWPGQITSHRIRGAFVLYFNFALIFAACYRLVWDLRPDAFTDLAGVKGEPQRLASMLYFSFVTLTSTGFGDIAPVHPFARSLANLEAIIGQLYPATLLARLVTLRMEKRTKH